MRIKREPGLRRCGSSLIGALAVWAVWAGSALAQTTLFDPRFEEIRHASVVWDNRLGPAREVVDLVCLVPDLATFLDVVSTWDEHHYFPVLIDDVEYTFKFLRAFRPARVVRYDPRKVNRLSPETTWQGAVAAVGKGWTQADDKALAGDTVPVSLGPVPPGVVVSSPDSPMLAAAVALAAARFQPLLRWETPKHYSDGLTHDEARALALDLETRIAAVTPQYDRLGDDCDFVTLAGDYPYRYQADATNAVDDLLLRPSSNPRRWGFVGRLMGDQTRSVYQAMCSLFLQPTSAMLFNGYGQNDHPWIDYAMSQAVARLSPLLKVTHRNGERASLLGWHQALDPLNPYGLMLINSHGGPTIFNLNGGPAQTADIPETVPTAVLIIHSFSAATPHDPQTIAGRWLANGAFVYYGSVNEPYLQSFRTPGLVGSFLAENLPLVTAVRQSPPELAGQPWRLMYFGDPLYRIRPTGQERARLATWEPTASWSAYGEFQQPGTEESESLRLKWVLREAIYLTQTTANARQKVDLSGTLLGIARARLVPGLQSLYDDLLIETLLQARRTSELIERLNQIPPAERSASVVRHLETAEMAALARAQAAKNQRQAMALWSSVIRSTGSQDFVPTFTERVSHLSEADALTMSHWRERLRSALSADAEPTNRPIIEAEIKRSAAKVGTANGR